MRIENYIMDTINATTTQSFDEVNQIIYISNGATATKSPVARYLNVRPDSVKKRVAAAEVLQVATTTFVGTANGSTYQIKVMSTSGTSDAIITRTYTITTPSTGTITATSIAAQFAAAITADSAAYVTATSGATLVITAKAGTPVFTVFVSMAQNGSGSTAYTGGSNVTGVFASGLTPYYDLYRWGIAAGTFTGSTAGYTRYQFIADKWGAEVNTLTAQQPSIVNVWINTDSANAAALITAIDAIWAQATYNRETVELTINTP